MATSRRRTCNDYYIPEELIFHILSLLPAKSFTRLKLVCKLWLSIISSTPFVQTHLANSRKKQALVIDYLLCDPFIEVHDTYQGVVYRIYLPLSCIPGLCYINSCDGLVCLSNRQNDVIHIWNPRTGKFKLLPAPPNKEYSSWSGNLGLGFDPISSDYKLFRIAFKTSCPPGAELYSANADSWKNIEIPALMLNTFCPRASKLVHAKTGVLYLEGERELLAFDLHSEVFQLYPFPHFGHHLRSNVLDFEGHVAIICQSTDDGFADLDLYILEDDARGSKLSCWTKMFKLQKPSGLKMYMVVRYLGLGEFFFIKDSKAAFSFYYNYKNREAKAFIRYIPALGESCAVKYTESLLSLDGFQQGRLNRWPPHYL